MLLVGPIWIVGSILSFSTLMLWDFLFFDDVVDGLFVVAAGVVGPVIVCHGNIHIVVADSLPLVSSLSYFATFGIFDAASVICRLFGHSNYGLPLSLRIFVLRCHNDIFLLSILHGRGFGTSTSWCCQSGSCLWIFVNFVDPDVVCQCVALQAATWPLLGS